jgi:amidohydrolase
LNKHNRELVNQFYEQLHGLAEIAFEERETSLYLEKRLIEFGFTLRQKPGLTGMVGFLDSGVSGPTIALHSDIDALLHVGTDGNEGAVHSCGHDANTAIVLASIAELIKRGIPEKGRLAVVFQPAEEKGLGAKAFLAEGMMEGIDVLIGSHLRPIEEVPLGKVVPALYHGASLSITGTIKGEAAHGARPHLGINVLDVAFNIFNLVNSIHLNPMIPHSVKMTRLVAGGSSFNQIPDRAEFAFDLRAQNNQLMHQLVEKVVSAIEMGTKALDAKAEIVVGEGCPAAEYDRDLIKLAEEAIREALGAEGLEKPISTPGGEDFHYYTEAIPQLKAVYLGLGADLRPGLHHPKMSFERQALVDGIKVLSKLVEKAYQL